MNPEERDMPRRCIERGLAIEGQERRIAEFSMALTQLVKDVAEIRTRVLQLPDRTGEILGRLDERLNALSEQDVVTRAEFEPVKRLVYGVVTLILVAFMTALISVAMNGGFNAKAAATPEAAAPAR